MNKSGDYFQDKKYLFRTLDTFPARETRNIAISYPRGSLLDVKTK